MKNAAKILTGLFILGTALVGYRFNTAQMHQLTFISNALCGSLLMVDGTVGMVCKKSLPALLYQLVLPCILTVFCCVFIRILGWHSFNFRGMFFFMHAINPVIFLAMYLFTTELELRDNADYVRRIFIAPIPVVSYAGFDYIRFLITGKLVYGLVSAKRLTFIKALVIGICFYAVVAVVSYGLLELKLYIERKRGNEVFRDRLKD